MCCCDIYKDKVQNVLCTSCHVALTGAGAALVPVLVFGENDIWHAHHVKEGNIHKVQEAVKRCALVQFFAEH